MRVEKLGGRETRGGAFFFYLLLKRADSGEVSRTVAHRLWISLFRYRIRFLYHLLLPLLFFDPGITPHQTPNQTSPPAAPPPLLLLHQQGILEANLWGNTQWQPVLSSLPARCSVSKSDFICAVKCSACFGARGKCAVRHSRRTCVTHFVRASCGNNN